MTREQLEQWLSALPTRQLPAELEQRLLTRIQQTPDLDAPAPPRGLGRPVLLWHALAAAALGLGAGFLASSLLTEPNAPPPIVVEMRSDWLAARATTGHAELNISNWTPQRLPAGNASGETP